MADDEETVTEATKPQKAKQDVLKKLNFRPQCFIVDMLPYFSALPYKNFPRGQGIYTAHENILMLPPGRAEGLQGDQAFLDKITVPLMESNLLERVPKELMSSLNPSVKLYKVVYKDENDKEGIDLRLPFNNLQDPAKFAASPTTPLQKTYEGLVPGHLVAGLKEFTFDFIGTNPASVDVFIDCGLRIYFSSVDALFHDYKANKSLIEKHKLTDAQATYSFIDLIRRPKKFLTTKDGHKIFNHEHFRIKIEIEYQVPPDDYLNEILKKSFVVSTRGGRTLEQEKKRIKSALRKSKLTMFLNLMRHEFQFNTEIPSGPFEITFTYNGAVESALVANEMDILRPEFDCPAANEEKNSDEGKALKAIEEKIKAKEKMGQKVLDILKQEPKEKFFKKWIPAGKPDRSEAYDPTSKDFDRIRIGAGSFVNPREGLLGNWTAFLGFAPEQTANFIRETVLHSKHAEIKYTVTPFPPNSKVSLIVDFYKARESLQTFKDQNGLTDADIRAKAYTRIIRNLMQEHTIGGVKVRKIYNVSFPTGDLEAWLTRKQTGKYTKEELQKLRTSETDSSPDGRKTISDIKTARANRMKEVGNQRAAFIKTLSGQDVIKADINAENTKDLKERTRDRINGQKPDTDGTEGEKVTTGGNPWNELAGGSSVAPEENFNLKFFFFGDLIDEALRILVDIHGNLHPNLHLNLWRKKNNARPKKNKLHIILGNFEYKDTFSKEMKKINLADYPISLSAFVEFWNKKVINKLKEKYLFKQFLIDCIKELVLKPLKTECRWIDSDNPGLQPFIDYVTIPPTARDLNIRTLHIGRGKPPVGVEFMEGIERSFPNSVKPQAKNSGLDNQVMFVSLQTTDPSYLANDKETDMKNGILYLPMGREGTPLLSIDFERIDQPYIMEARAEKGLLSDVTQLSEVYDCNFKTYGNLSVRTGKRVYVAVPHFGDINSDLKQLRKRAYKNPLGFQREIEKNPSVLAQLSRSRLLGLGGYYLITKTQHRIGIDGSRMVWTTEAKMRWDSFGDTPEKRATKVTREEEFKRKLAGQRYDEINEDLFPEGFSW